MARVAGDPGPWSLDLGPWQWPRMGGGGGQVGACKVKEVGGREFKWHLSGKRQHAAAAHENKSGINKLNRTLLSSSHIESITPDSELKYCLNTLYSNTWQYWQQYWALWQMYNILQWTTSPKTTKEENLTPRLTLGTRLTVKNSCDIGTRICQKWQSCFHKALLLVPKWADTKKKQFEYTRFPC